MSHSGTRESREDSGIESRHIAVIGARHGIGRAVVEALGAGGARVAAFDICERALQSLDCAFKSAVDVRDERLVEAAIDNAERALGKLDGLFYSAAAPNHRATVEVLEPSAWDDCMAINLRGAFLAARSIIPALRRAGGGDVVFVASELGRVGATANPAYCASKGALVQLAKAMALDHGGEGIRVNTLSPGPVWTERFADRFATREDADHAIGARTALARMGDVDEVARAAVFMFSRGARYMTGADLLVDGGYTAG
jgi:NAD(P)-dependent dehydrogenase (short-subunit alcohol dehydrogenase family)